MKPLFLKTDNPDGIPSSWEISDFEARNDCSINEVPRLYVKFKVGKRKKVKRLRLKKTVYPCEYCGSHAYASGKVGNKEFDKEIF